MSLELSVAPWGPEAAWAPDGSCWGPYAAGQAGPPGTLPHPGRGKAPKPVAAALAATQYRLSVFGGETTMDSGHKARAGTHRKSPAGVEGSELCFSQLPCLI